MLSMITELPKTVSLSRDETTVGNYFVSNYPPTRSGRLSEPEKLRRWNEYLRILLLESISISPSVESAVTSAISKFTPTKTRRVGATWRQQPGTEIYTEKPFLGGRKPRFIYFGGGTPSYISSVGLLG
jgi:oxygen-independent coproporphyrinogen-3 oxidase